MFSTAMEQLPRVIFCIKAKKQEKCWITSWTHIWRTSWGGCFSLKSFSEMLFKIEISNDSLTNSVLEKTLFCLNRVALNGRWFSKCLTKYLWRNLIFSKYTGSGPGNILKWICFTFLTYTVTVSVLKVIHIYKLWLTLSNCALSFHTENFFFLKNIAFCLKFNSISPRFY